MGKVAKFFGFELEQFEPVENIRQGSIDSAGGDSPLNGVIPPAFNSWVSLDPVNLMKISSVSRSVQIIATSVSSLELEMYENGLVVDASPLVRRPDPFTPRKLWVQELVTSMAMYGNAYAKVSRDGRQAVQALTILAPSSVTVTKQSGVIAYMVNGKRVPTKDIVHFKLDRLPGEVMGYGPIQHQSSVFELATMLERYAATQFDTNAVPRGKITTTSSVNPEDAQDIANSVREFIEKNGGILVLTDGFDYSQIVGDPTKTQYLDVQKATDLKIARLFGIPAEALQMGTDNSSTYQNTQDQNLRFLQSTLDRYLTEIEEQLTELLPAGKSVKFREEDLLRLDIKGKWEVAEIQSRIGYTSGDELRAAEGKEPLPKQEETPKGVPVPVNTKEKSDDE